MKLQKEIKASGSPGVLDHLVSLRAHNQERCKSIPCGSGSSMIMVSLENFIFLFVGVDGQDFQFSCFPKRRRRANEKCPDFCGRGERAKIRRVFGGATEADCCVCCVF